MSLLHILLGGLLLWSSLLHTTTCLAATEKNDTLAAGEALAMGDKLVSRNGKFALGFFQFQFQQQGRPAGSNSSISKSKSPTTTTTTTTNASSSSGWYLGIWFNKIPVFTTVWVANRENPITDTDHKLAQLKISRDGNLLVTISNNNKNNNASTEPTIIWSSTTADTVLNSTNNTITTNSNISAVLMNTGNLALTIPAQTPSPNQTTPSPLWQNFDYPTDVALPGSKAGRNKLTGFGQLFISKKSLIDPGLGSYSVEIDVDGVLLLRSRSPPSVVYWTWPSGKLGELVAALSALLQIDPRTKGKLTVATVNNDEEVYFAYTLLDESLSVFCTIGISGPLQLNFWSQEKVSWETVYAQPSDFCTPYAVCGPFTVCNNNAPPPSDFCGCMEGFSRASPRDWELEDRTGGCARNTPLHEHDCSSISGSSSTTSNRSRSTDVFHPIAQVTLPYEPRRLQDATTQSDCQEACLGDCSCTAYAYNNSICSVWHGDLLNVNQDDGHVMISQDVLYIRLAAGDSQGTLRSNRGIPRLVIVAGIVGSGLVVLMLLLLVIWRNRFRWCNATSSHGDGGGIIAFRYSDLSRATKNFSEKLGAGGFGSVFKGVLNDSTSIAVKRLDGAHQLVEKQFRAEVSSIGLIQHINLVKLIGFCCGSGDNRLLVYEHMPNGSLEGHMFKSSTPVLNWNTRYQIAIGVARGLLYLHKSCRECIIHCDIKPENILLDASFVPKIADFGMATFVGRDYSRVLTTSRGTKGYLAPEWLSGVAITPKVDVYSFGMVLMEIISGSRNNSSAQAAAGTDGSSFYAPYFPVEAINRLHEGGLQSLVDPELHGDFDLQEVERVCRVASWCIQDNDFHRPAMDEVVRALEGLQDVDAPPMPRLLAAMTRGVDSAASVSV